MEFNIRNIIKDDYQNVFVIWRNELGYSGSFEAMVGRIDKMMVDDNYHILVALHDGQIVGNIAAVRKIAFEFDSFLHITGLAVLKEYQNKGIGSSLIKRMEEYAVMKGIPSIILNSGVQRTTAHTFYEKNGYAKLSYCFTKRLVNDKGV